MRQFQYNAGKLELDWTYLIKIINSPTLQIWTATFTRKTWNFLIFINLKFHNFKDQPDTKHTKVPTSRLHAIQWTIEGRAEQDYMPRHGKYDDLSTAGQNEVCCSVMMRGFLWSEFICQALTQDSGHTKKAQMRHSLNSIYKW